MFTILSMLNVFINLTLLVQVVVALLLILVVLMQRPKQEGLGATFGAGMTDQMFGAQTTNVLQKATVWFGIIFFSSTLILAILTNKKNTANSLATGNSATVENVEGADGSGLSLAEQLSQAEATDANNSAETVPNGTPIKVTPAKEAPSGSLLDQLNDAGESTEDAVKEGASNAGDAVENSVSGATSTVKKATENAGNEAKKAAAKAKQEAKKAARAAKKAAQEAAE